MHLLIYIYLFFLGLAVGSFINALEYRLFHHQSITLTRSRCPHCQQPIKWFDLVPLLSWIALKGRCRSCQQKISCQYPVVELVTGCLFLVIFFMFSNQLSIRDFINYNYLLLSPISPSLVSPNLPGYLKFLFLFYLYFLVSSLLVIFIYDLKYMLIPDKIVFPATITTFFTICGLTYLQFYPSLERIVALVIVYLLSALGAGTFFSFLIFITKGRGVGGGDVKLGFLMGLALGYPQIVYALYIAYLIGAIVAIWLLITKKKRLGQPIPFGPFLIIGTLVGLLF